MSNTVLVVDDEADFRELICELLELEGFSGVAVDDGYAALEYLRDPSTQRPAVIVLDWMMPGLDGFHVIGKLRAEPAFADIPVVVLSAGGDTVADTVKKLSHKFVPKPHALELLVDALKPYRASLPAQ